jgi:hypothetical protein
MHRNTLRGVHYLPTRRAAGGAEPDRFTLKPTSDFPLDGDPKLNVRGGVYPLDGDGDGRFGFLHFNGYRLMRAYTQLGRKLWQVDNPGGQVHRSVSHRFTLAVFDADGEPGQEIVHCWSDPGVREKLLVLRDGETGRVLEQARLAGQGKGEECQIAAFRVAGQAKPLVLVAGKAPAADCAKGNWTETFSRTIAFRADLTKAWERTTCNAGHYAWPLDEAGDGLAEAVFVGKYLLRPDGTTRCVLPGLGDDHVDSMVVADLDPGLGGHEALAVGSSGTRFFAAGGCTLRWRIPPSTVGNPQQTAAAYLDAGARAPDLLVTTKLPDTFSDQTQRAYTLNARGQVVGSYTENVERFAAPSQNANLDGAPAAEDRVATFGQVVDGRGRRRLMADWYWGLQELTPAEEGLDAREQWSRNPFAFDFNNDGRDELVVWGRRRLVLGTRAAP